MLEIYRLLLMLCIFEMPPFFLFHFPLCFLSEGFVQKKYMQGWGSQHCMLTGTVESDKRVRKDRHKYVSNDGVWPL